MSEYKHHKYQWRRSFSSVNHKWQFVGELGAVSFHVSVMDDCEKFPNPSCGLEFHSYTGIGAPDHTDCDLTGGRCWHDGTSLFASETVWPQVEPMLRISGDHDAIFNYLEHIATQHFKREQNQ